MHETHRSNTAFFPFVFGYFTATNWKAFCNNLTNANGSGINTSLLRGNITNIVTTVISCTGTISLFNNSTNPYHVYVNGALTISNMLGGTTQLLQFKPTGNYTIRILLVSGYVFESTDITYTVNLSIRWNADRYFS